MKVIGAIGTLPARAESLVHTLRSIARQTMPLDALTIFGDRYSSLEELSRAIAVAGALPFHVYVVVGDVGTSSKYHAALHAMGSDSGFATLPPDAVAFFDDDIDYDPRHVERSVALIRQKQTELGTPLVRVGVLAEIVTQRRIPSWNARDVRCVQFPFGDRLLSTPLEVHNIGVGMMTASWEAAQVFVPAMVRESPRLGCEPYTCGLCLAAGVRTFAIAAGVDRLVYTTQRHAWMSHTAPESRATLDAYAREVEWPPLPLPTQPHRGRERRAARLARRGITRT